MSNFLENKSKKIIIAILAILIIGLGIPKVESAASSITASPLYSGSDRTTGEILQSDIVNGKKIKFTLASNITMYRYAWNLNIGGETKQSAWITAPKNTRTIEIPVDIYNNGKNVPLGLLELSVSTWDGSTTPTWLNIPYYVVNSLASEANRDRVPPIIRATNFIVPQENEKNPVIVKNGEGKFTLKATDLGYKQNSEKSTGVYCIVAELVKELRTDTYTSNAKVLYNKDTLTVGYGNDVDIKFPTQKGSWYVQMYAIDGTNNPSSTQWVKFEIRDDIVPPQITINLGSNGLVEQFIELNGSYVEYGATAKDNIDGNITTKVISSTIDTKRVGTYKVTYEAVDSAGNRATAERTVYVVDRSELKDKIKEAEDAEKNSDYSEESRNKIPDIIKEVKDEMNNVPQDKIPELIDKIQKVLDELKVANPQLKNIEIHTNKTIDEETSKYYIKPSETVEITFNTGVTEINSIETFIINGREISDKTKIKLEKLDGFNYKITYTLTNEDNEIAEDRTCYIFIYS
ncbi:MAG: DUF5011 domain-containing protein [Clostridia bacterium]|jgi:hypothetical protein|nr:DUF5011 domain-containing protein [Clostridia bacterium]